MDEYAFRQKVTDDLTSIRISLGRMDERLKTIENVRKWALTSTTSAVIAVVVVFVEFTLRRL